MFFLESGVLANETEQGFGGGGVIACFGIEVIILTEFFVFVSKANEFVGISSYIINRDIVKGIYGLEPVTIKIENFFVKSAVVGKSALDIKKSEKSAHILGDISPLFKADFLGSHAIYINGALVRIVGGRKQFRIVPNLLDTKFSFMQDFSRFGVVEDKADIITKRLFQTGGFGVKHANFHFLISFLQSVCPRTSLIA